MTLKIEVTIPEDEIRSDAASQYLVRAMSAIGFSRPPTLKWMRAEPEVALASSVPNSTGDDLPPAATAAAEAELPPAASIAAREADAAAATPAYAASEGWPTPAGQTAPKRERGKPSPGRARRTKEEIAEDEAAEKAEASAPAPEPVALISTGEERIDPTSPEDAAQDAADEAAEAQGAQAPELTHDDVRAALKKYLDAYGTPAAMEDGPKVLTLVFGKPTPKVSDVPADQESLSRAIAGIEEMLTKNPYKREAQL